MPLIRIEIIKGKDREYKQKLLEAVHGALERTLGIAEWDRFQRLYEFEPADFERSPQKSDSFTMIELTLFPGRSSGLKELAQQAITAALGESLGIAPEDVFIIMHEPPLENWCLGGRNLGEKKPCDADKDADKSKRCADADRKLVEGGTYDEERALYNLTGALVRGCRFEGPADGESALKESRDVVVENCGFHLRYPLWHSHMFTLRNSTMDINTRAPLWYAEDGVISGCTIDGPKCLRECRRISIDGSAIVSPEFGWNCHELAIRDTSITSEYFMLGGTDARISGLAFKGKYSFQYTENLVIENSVLDTKDAFWHGKNITVRNCKVIGEYLAWYSDGLTLINCEISGTQPLCYCKNLRLIDCTMNGTDLAFEYSDVYADVVGDIMSVKNPRSGRIAADSIGEIIFSDSVVECECDIVTRGAR